MRLTLISLTFALLTLFTVSQPIPSWAQGSFEEKPINYGKRKTHDPVALLQRQLESGKVKLEFSEKHGYLPAVLKALKISPKSQTLVFSRTSFQIRKIAPPNPRALYFNDDTYIGWVQNGDVIEVSSVDPQQGTIFYAMENQEKVEKPKFVRLVGDCLVCHASSRTADVPGSFTRSVLANRSGHPILGSRTYTVDHTRPIEERWGGWYVTGTHGKQRHLGNLTLKGKRDLYNYDTEPGANITDLSKLFDVKPYLTKNSDIIALMLLEHQGKMHNLVTRVNFENRQAVHYDKIMNKALERPDDHISESTHRRIDSAAKKLVAYMLFSDEAKITEPIKGTAGFEKEFLKNAIRDSKGRSLKDLDFKTRMLKYPCSYLIYAEAFDKIPDLARGVVYKKLWAVLSGEDKSKAFQHLSEKDRIAILEILVETKKTLPADWKKKLACLKENHKKKDAPILQVQ